MNTFLAIDTALMTALVLLIVVATITRKTFADRRDARFANILDSVRPAVFKLVSTDGKDQRPLLEELEREGPRSERAMRRRATNLQLLRFADNLRGDVVQEIREFLISQGFSREAAEDLRSRSPWKRALAVQELGFLADDDYLYALVRRLDDRDEAVRIAAARALGNLRDAAATAHLLAARDGKRTVPYGPVSHSLLKIGPPGVPNLIDALGHPSFRVRRMAIDVLGELGVSQIDQELIRILRTDRDTLVRIRAAHAVGRIGTSEVLSQLYASLQAENADIRGSIIRAVARIGARGSLPVLRRALDDDDHATARAAARALIEMGDSGRAILRARAASLGGGAAYAIEALDTLGLATDAQREWVRTLNRAAVDEAPEPATVG